MHKKNNPYNKLQIKPKIKIPNHLNHPLKILNILLPTDQKFLIYQKPNLIIPIL